MNKIVLQCNLSRYWYDRHVTQPGCSLTTDTAPCRSSCRRLTRSLWRRSTRGCCCRCRERTWPRNLLPCESNVQKQQNKTNKQKTQVSLFFVHFLQHCSFSLFASVTIFSTGYLMKPISSQPMAASSWLALDEQTCLHRRWAESNTRSLWSATLTCTVARSKCAKGKVKDQIWL